MIEKDYMAQDATSKIRITKYFPPATPLDTKSSHKSPALQPSESTTKSITDEEAMAQLMEENDVLEDDFSDIDIDFSLPDIEDLLKGSRAHGS